jgi:hypothetical protein
LNAADNGNFSPAQARRYVLGPPKVESQQEGRQRLTRQTAPAYSTFARDDGGGKLGTCQTSLPLFGSLA